MVWESNCFGEDRLDFSMVHQVNSIMVCTTPKFSLFLPKGTVRVTDYLSQVRLWLFWQEVGRP